MYIQDKLKILNKSVTVNFMCQLDWVVGCRDTQLNNILGVFVRMFLDEINI